MVRCLKNQKLEHSVLLPEGAWRIWEPIKKSLTKWFCMNLPECWPLTITFRKKTPRKYQRFTSDRLCSCFRETTWIRWGCRWKKDLKCSICLCFWGITGADLRKSWTRCKTKCSRDFNPLTFDTVVFKYEFISYQQHPFFFWGGLRFSLPLLTSTGMKLHISKLTSPPVCSQWRRERFSRRQPQHPADSWLKWSNVWF